LQIKNLDSKTVKVFYLQVLSHLVAQVG